MSEMKQTDRAFTKKINGNAKDAGFRRESHDKQTAKTNSGDARDNEYYFTDLIKW